MTTIETVLAPGVVIEFTCNGRGRGGHYFVTATVTKVNRKTVAAVECNRSYSPGTRWSVSKEFINKVRAPRDEHPCPFCLGTGKAHQNGTMYNRKCVMCDNGIIKHESFIG